MSMIMSTTGCDKMGFSLLCAAAAGRAEARISIVDGGDVGVTQANVVNHGLHDTAAAFLINRELPSRCCWQLYRAAAAGSFTSSILPRNCECPVHPAVILSAESRVDR